MSRSYDTGGCVAAKRDEDTSPTENFASSATRMVRRVNFERRAGGAGMVGRELGRFEPGWREPIGCLGLPGKIIMESSSWTPQDDA